MKKYLYFLLILRFTSLFAQEYEPNVFFYQNDTLPYRILLPKDFDSQKSYPLLIFLHGLGERGKDNELQLFHGGSLFQSDEFRAKYSAIVVFPQCPVASYWASVKRDYDTSLNKKHTYAKALPENPQLEIIEALIKSLEQSYSIDPSRRYIGGLSMGGMGTFELVSRNPDFFAAAFPICGGANPNWAPLLSKTHLWIFHGEMDDVVWVEHSKRMFRALKKLYAPVRFTLYPDIKHDSWHNAFTNPDLMKWLFSKTKKYSE